MTDIPAEDWYRAALLLRFYHRHTSETKKATGFLSKDQSKLSPRLMEYFSPEDVQGLDKMEIEEADGDLDKRTRGEQMAEINDEIAATEEPELQKFKDVIGYVEFVEGRAADWEQAVETVDKDIRRNAPTLGSAGRTAKRVRMTENQLRQACAHLGRLVKVKHDDPSMQDALASHQNALEEDNQLAEQAQGLISRGINVGEADVCVDELIDDMTEEEREQYWKTQSSLSTVSATTPSFAEACQQLGYEPAHPSPFPDLWARRQVRLQHREAGEVAAQENDNAGEEAEDGAASMAIGPIPEVLELNGWQVTGAAWALQQERLPIRGGMIADDCGMGKTIIMLVVILEQYRQAVRAHVDGATGP